MPGSPGRSPVRPDWRARLRRWLWLDGNNVRTDHSRANRGFYVGGQPVTRRFILPVVAVGVVIALIILFTRGADGTTAHEQRLLLAPAGPLAGAWTGHGPADGLG